MHKLSEAMHKLSEALIKFLKGDVDAERLKVQLCMLPDTIKTALNGTIKRVTNVRTIADAMMQSEICFVKLIKFLCYISHFL